MAATGIFATAGARVYIGHAMSAQSIDFVLADFNNMSWIEIDWLENIGAFGDEAAEITFDAIGEGRTQKLKGTRNAGNMELVAGIDPDDAGQAAMRAAEEADTDYAFKVEFNDSSLHGVNSKRYFIGKVMSARETLEGANNVARLNMTIGINSNIVRTTAT